VLFCFRGLSCFLVRPYIEESLWQPSQKIEALKVGGIILEMAVSEPKEVGWWVMQWGARAEVLQGAGNRLNAGFGQDRKLGS
jgi:hypothetical protein